MTHACLRIEGPDGRALLMHTPHSGYLIPEIIKEAPKLIALHRFRFLVEEGDVREKYPTPESLKESLAALAFSDGLDYPPTIASVLCAVRPWVLQPIPAEFAQDLPAWGGQDHPCVLKLHKNVWTIDGPDIKVMLQPQREMFKALWDLRNQVISKQHGP